jgi:hypothetical protein
MNAADYGAAAAAREPGAPGSQDRGALCYRTQLWSARKPQTGLYW